MKCMHKTFEYRLYPNRMQQRLLFSCLAESRRIYNEMLELVKDHYTQSGESLGRYDLTCQFKGRGGKHVPQSTVQALCGRLDKALKRFLNRKERKEKIGFPRFKSGNRWHSIHLRQYGKGHDVFLDHETKRLRVPKKLGGSIKIKQHRPIEGIPKTAYLVRRADGHWYVLVVCDLGARPPLKDGPTIGIDLGLKVFLADSEGQTVENPRYYRRSQKKLRKAQRKTCRRKKGSNRRKRAARLAAKRHLKIARQRKDFLHKTARKYVDRYALVAVEDLNIQRLTKNRPLAKSITDASWSSFVSILDNKAEEAGCRVVKVLPRFTTQRCSSCGEMVRKSLSVRIHSCDFCGHVEDRDVNAAKNILLAGMQPSERKVAGCGELAPRSRLL